MEWLSIFSTAFDEQFRKKEGHLRERGGGRDSKTLEANRLQCVLKVTFRASGETIQKLLLFTTQLLRQGFQSFRYFRLGVPSPDGIHQCLRIQNSAAVHEQGSANRTHQFGKISRPFVVKHQGNRILTET